MAVDPIRFRSPPDWRTLLEVGLDRLRHAHVYGWYFAATIVLSIVSDLTPRGGPFPIFLGVFALLAEAYLSLLLARQLMSGRVEFTSRDGANVARLLGLYFAIMALVGIPLMLTALFMMFGRSPVTLLWPILVVGGLFALYLMVRTAFYLPALALGEPTSVPLSYAQGTLFWRQLSAVLFIALLLAIGAEWLIRQLGLYWLATAVLEGALFAASALVWHAALCHLYWTEVRAST